MAIPRRLMTEEMVWLTQCHRTLPGKKRRKMTPVGKSKTNGTVAMTAWIIVR